MRSQGKLHTSEGLERKITEQTSNGREYRKHLRPTTAGSVQSIAWGKNLPRVELERSKKAIILTRKTGTTYTWLYLLMIMIDDDVEGACHDDRILANAAAWFDKLSGRTVRDTT